MNEPIVRNSPAKINLILRVLGKRTDGYHELASLMQRVSLCDEMTFVSRRTGIVLHCPGCKLPTNEENIVFRAAKMFFNYIRWQGGIEITVRKKIPLAAGLGGGSSNAATTLMVLNEITRAGLSKETLMKLGLKLGADVPFFIFEKTAWAFGVGERLREANEIPAPWFLLVNPGFEIPTRAVYEGLKYGLTNEPIQYNIPRLQTVFQIAGGLHNDLETVSEKICPAVKEIKNRMRARGSLGSLMSGSGPTVFGIFENKAAAENAESEFEKDNFPFLCSAHAL